MHIKKMTMKVIIVTECYTCFFLSAYVLRCGLTRFYRLWYRYYEQYQSVTKIFRVLYRNRIFEKVNFATYYKRHKGFTLKGKIFKFNSKCMLINSIKSLYYDCTLIIVYL